MKCEIKRTRRVFIQNNIIYLRLCVCLLIYARVCVWVCNIIMCSSVLAARERARVVQWACGPEETKTDCRTWVHPACELERDRPLSYCFFIYIFFFFCILYTHRVHAQRVFIYKWVCVCVCVYMHITHRHNRAHNNTYNAGLEISTRTRI